MDDDFIASRRKGGKNRPKHAGEGLLAGGKSLSTGVLKGVTGLFVDPIKGARQNGVEGFLTGLGKGEFLSPIFPYLYLYLFMLYVVVCYSLSIMDIYM